MTEHISIVRASATTTENVRTRRGNTTIVHERYACICRTWVRFENIQTSWAIFCNIENVLSRTRGTAVTAAVTRMIYALMVIRLCQCGQHFQHTGGTAAQNQHYSDNEHAAHKVTSSSSSATSKSTAQACQAS